MVYTVEALMCIIWEITEVMPKKAVNNNVNFIFSSHLFCREMPLKKLVLLFIGKKMETNIINLKCFNCIASNIFMCCLVFNL